MSTQSPVAAPDIRESARAAHRFDPPQGSPSVHLDALRGLAAVAVLFCHWWDACFVLYDSAPHTPLNTVFYYLGDFGHAWVVIFFVLSGFLVGGSVLRQHRSGKWSWSSYLLIRLTRLYVVLLPALFLGGVLDYAGMRLPGSEVLYSGNSGMNSLHADVRPNLSPRVLAGNLLFLEKKRVPAYGSNGPLWSLSHEFWYYLAFPFLFLIFARATRLRARLLCLALVSAWAVFVGHYVAILFPVWLAGLLPLFLPPFPAKSTLARRLSVAFALLVVAVGFVLRSGSLLPDNPEHFPVFHVFVGNPPWQIQVSDILLGLAVALLLWILLHCATGPLPRTYTWLAQNSARFSYTLYLVHFPLLVFLVALLHFPRSVPSLHSVLLALPIFAAILLYAMGVYQLFEKRTPTVRKWIQSRARRLGYSL